MDRLQKAFLAGLIAVLSAIFARIDGSRAVEPPAGKGSELIIYTYESFTGKDGLGAILRDAFRKKTGTDLKYVTVGDAGQLLSRLQLDLEKSKPQAHLVLGIDQNLYPRVKHLLAPLEPSKEGAFMKYVDRDWWLGDPFVPFDYGVLAFIADTQKLPPDDFPKKWDDLTKRRFKKSLLLEDPRTSSPGLGFVLGSIQAAAASVGEKFPPVSTEEVTPTPEKTRKAFTEFWEDLKGKWITLTPGWSQAYGMFLKGEAPMVWSYVTSEAYHRMKAEKADQDRYRAVIFEDGHPVQIEGAAILKDAPGGAAMRKRAVEFLELLVSEEIQKKIPETQWMMPTRLGVKIPAAFQALPVAKKRFSADVPREKLDEAIELWRKAIQ